MRAVSGLIGKPSTKRRKPVLEKNGAGHDRATLMPDQEAAGAQVRQFHGVALVAGAADVARALQRPEVVS